MKESVTYQAIVEEGVEKGRRQEAKKIILTLGKKRFGQPGSEILRRLDALDDLDALEALHSRLLDVDSWEELLGTE